MQRSALLLLYTFGTYYITIALVARYALPRLAVGYVPVEPALTRVMTREDDPKIGSPIPPELAKTAFPVTLVVHNECLTCTLAPSEDIKRCFEVPGVVNVVVAATQDEYHRIAKLVNNPSVLYHTPALGDKLNAVFGPRVYGYDGQGKLIFIQQSPSENLSETIEDCRKTLSK